MSSSSAPRDRRVVLGTAGGGAEYNSAIPAGQGPAIPARPDAEFRGWYSRGYLPHLDVPGLIQHITFHLADALPREALKRMQASIAHVADAKRDVERRRRLQELVDAGHGSCLLVNPACAQVVQDSLLFGDGDRYRLLAWVVMPNHVHVLIEQLEGWPLSKVVQSWKRHTAREVHRLGFGLGPTSRGTALGSPSSTRQSAKSRVQLDNPGTTALWQRDYWDRYIRNDRHLAVATHYIEQNPVSAGLCAASGDWRWSSAFVARPDDPDAAVDDDPQGAVNA